MKKEKLNKFSIRKLSVGAASVLVGVALAGGATTAFAAGPDTNQPSTSQTEKSSVVVFKTADNKLVGYTVVKGLPTEANVKSDVPDGYNLVTPVNPSSVGTDDKPEYEVAVVEKSLVEKVQEERIKRTGLSYEDITKKHDAKVKFDEAHAAVKPAKDALDAANEAMATANTEVEVAKAQLALYKELLAKNPKANVADKVVEVQADYVKAVQEQLKQSFATAKAKAEFVTAIRKEAEAKAAYEKLGGQLADLSAYNTLEEIAGKMDEVKAEVAKAKTAVEAAKVELVKAKVEVAGKTDPVELIIAKFKLEDATTVLNNALATYNAKAARLNTLKTYFDEVHKTALVSTKAVTPSAAETPVAEAAEVAFSGVAKTFVKGHPNYAVAMMDANGVYTGKFLKQGSRFKVFGKKTIKGRVCYRLGTQSQWVPAEFLVF
ncbi:MAG: YSIRK-type signal peptide-containing protein, partial [Lactobacillus iners]|nr:YSIRK-type signal peptide-containing protein [Lactobacillus iners]